MKYSKIVTNGETNNNVEFEPIILAFVGSDRRRREYYIHRRGGNMPNTEIETNLEKILQLMKTSFPTLDVSTLIHQLIFLYNNGTIDNVEMYKDIKQGFDVMPYIVPLKVSDCITEYELRESYADKLSNKGIIWSNEKQTQFKSELLQQAGLNSFDKQSKTDFIKNEFFKRTKDLESKEELFRKEYDYPLRSSFINIKGEFSANSESIIDFFYYCESHKKDAGHFMAIARSVGYYFDTYNEQQIINVILKEGNDLSAGKSQETEIIPNSSNEDIQSIIVPELWNNFDKVFDKFSNGTTSKIRKAAFITLLWEKKYFSKDSIKKGRVNTLPVTCLNKKGMIIFGESLKTQFLQKERGNLNTEMKKMKNSIFN